MKKTVNSLFEAVSVLMSTATGLTPLPSTPFSSNHPYQPPLASSSLLYTRPRIFADGLARYADQNLSFDTVGGRLAAQNLVQKACLVGDGNGLGARAGGRNEVYRHNVEVVLGLATT